MLNRRKRIFLAWFTLALLLGNLGLSGAIYYGSKLYEAEENEAMAGGRKIVLIGNEVATTVTEPSPGKEQVAAHATEMAASAPAVETMPVQMGKPEAAKPIPICYEVGPFESAATSSKLRKALETQKISAELIEKKRTEELGYWVYLPPERSLALGRLKEEELKTKGLKDVMLVAKSEPKNAISLGVFKFKNTAEQRLAQVQALGYAPRMEMRMNEEVESWLAVRTERGKDLQPNEWLGLLDGLKGVELKTVECQPTN